MVVDGRGPSRRCDPEAEATRHGDRGQGCPKIRPSTRHVAEERAQFSTTKTRRDRDGERTGMASEDGCWESSRPGQPADSVSTSTHSLYGEFTRTDMICVLVLVGARPAVLCPVLPRSGPDQGRPLAVATLRLVVRCSIIPADSAGRGQGRKARSNRATTSASLRTTKVVRDCEEGRTHDGHDRIASFSSFVCALYSLCLLV